MLPLSLRLCPRSLSPFLVSSLARQYSTKSNEEGVEMPSSKTKALRKAVNQLLLRVHPDFFRHDPVIARVRPFSLFLIS